MQARAALSLLFATSFLVTSASVAMQQGEKERESKQQAKSSMAQSPFITGRKMEVDVRSIIEKKLRQGANYIYRSMSGLTFTAHVKGGKVVGWEVRDRGRQRPVGFERTATGECWIHAPDRQANVEVWLHVPCSAIEYKIEKPTQ